jgi:hypothetical protein
MKKITLLLLFLLFLGVSVSAQKSIDGKLILDKKENKDFVLRNTKVILVTKTKTDSTSINEDLSFSFANIESDSASIYLKSPVLSPDAVTKFELRKRKPTRLKLNYEAIHRFSTTDNMVRNNKSDEQRFVEFSNALFLIKTIAEVFFIIKLIR